MQCLFSYSHLRVSRALLTIVLAAFSCGVLNSQNSPVYVDPQIKAALKEISPGQIQSDIEKLVSFQTRSTLSA